MTPQVCQFASALPIGWINLILKSCRNKALRKNPRGCVFGHSEPLHTRTAPTIPALTRHHPFQTRSAGRCGSGRGEIGLDNSGSGQEIHGIPFLMSTPIPALNSAGTLWEARSRPGQKVKVTFKGKTSVGSHGKLSPRDSGS